MDREVLKEILNTRYFEFTSEEIESIMNEELAKDPEEMDTDLVDLCLDALDGKFDYLKETGDNAENTKPVEKKAKTIHIKKILLIAAIVAILACVGIGVYANHRNIDVPEDVVKLQGDYYSVDLSNPPETLDDNISEEAAEASSEK